jgi:hypothetical protein
MPNSALSQPMKPPPLLTGFSTGLAAATGAGATGTGAATASSGSGAGAPGSTVFTAASIGPRAAICAGVIAARASAPKSCLIR